MYYKMDVCRKNTEHRCGGRAYKVTAPLILPCIADPSRKTTTCVCGDDLFSRVSRVARQRHGTGSVI